MSFLQRGNVELINGYMVPNWDPVPMYHAFDVTCHRINRLILKDEIVTITIPMSITLPPGVTLLVTSSPNAKVVCKKDILRSSTEQVTFTLTSKCTTMLRYNDIIARVVMQFDKVMF